MRVSSRQQPIPRRRTDAAGGIKLRETNPNLRQIVDPRRRNLAAIAAHIVDALVVAENHNDVRMGGVAPSRETCRDRRH